MSRFLFLAGGGAILIVLTLLWWWPAIGEWLDVDICLDRGGRWNEVERTCEGVHP
jgi:hypothetical protein